MKRKASQRDHEELEIEEEPEIVKIQRKESKTIEDTTLLKPER